jgi:hypothetical protein
MSFPLNPNNGQQAIVNGIKYNYDSNKNGWRRDFNNVIDRFFLVGNNQAVSTATGDLVVYGGAGFGKNVHVGGRLVVYNGADFIGTITGVISTSSRAISIDGGITGDLLYQSSTGTTAFLPISVAGSILVSNGVIPVWTTTAAISVATANTATNIAGGLSGYIPFQSTASQTTFNANLVYNGQSLLVSNTTPSVDTTSGAVIVGGGMGIAGDVYVGGNFQVNGTTSYVNSTNLDITDKNITLAKGAINSAAADGAGLTVEGPGILPTLLYTAFSDSWNFNKLTRSPSIEVTGGTASISTGTGALRITGGVGVHGSVFAVSLNGPLTGTIGAGTKNSGGFTTVEVTSLTSSTSVTTGALTVGGGVGIAGTLYSDQARIVSTQAASSNVTGALTVSGGVGIQGDLYVGGTIVGSITNALLATTATTALTSLKSNNITGGLVNQIPYQSGTDVTTFSPNLTFNGTTLTTTRLDILASSSNVLPNADLGISLINNSINQSPYIRLAGNSSGVVLLSAFGSLRVMQDGSPFTNNLLTVSPTGVTIPTITNSVSTTTGSLIIGGGVGVGGSINVADTITSNNIVVNSTVTTPRILAPINVITSASGLVVHDTAASTTFYHSGMTANFTANFTNVPTTNNREHTIKLIYNQGAVTGYYASIIQINGSAASVRYNTAPVPTASRIEVQTLTLVRAFNAWLVLGQFDEYI